MADRQNGLVFKTDDEQVWLGIFENGGIESFSPISDFELIYEDLPETKFCVVEIEFLENDNVAVNDLMWVEIGKVEEGKDPDNDENFESKTITYMLTDMEFPSEDANEMFASLIYSVVSAN